MSRRKSYNFDTGLASQHDVLMRTTVTIDDDLADSLKEQARQQNVPFKQVVNDVLRRGLKEEENGDKPPYRVRPLSLGLRPGIDETNLRHIDEEMQDEELIERFRRPKQ